MVDEWIPEDRIKSMSKKAATRLVKRLLETALASLSMARSSLGISLDIDCPDDGLDAVVDHDVPADHPWLPQGLTGWQIKSSSQFRPADAGGEPIDDMGALKPAVEDILERGGTYVLAQTGMDLNESPMKKKRKGEIESTFREAGYPDAEVKIFDAGQLATWVRETPQVAGEVEPRLQGLLRVHEWEDTGLELGRLEEFVADDDRRKLVSEIRRAIDDESDPESPTVIRITGPRGVGKRRLIYEVVKQTPLRELVLYARGPEDLPNRHTDGLRRKDSIREILIVNDCSPGEHARLRRELEGLGDRVTLVTLDFGTDEPHRPEDIHVELESLDTRTTQELVQQEAPDLTPEVASQVARLSGGYPLIARRLARSLAGPGSQVDAKTLREAGLDPLLKELVVGRGHHSVRDDTLVTVMEGMSLLRKVGWEDELRDQGRALMDNMGVPWTRASRAVQHLEKKGLIERRGRYRVATPHPLVVSMATEWWDRADRASWQGLLHDLPDAESKAAFLERLTDLPGSSTTRNILRTVISDIDLEALQVPAYSRLVRRAVSVDRLFVLNVLEGVVENASIEELKDFQTGRRDLIEALRKAAWWSDTFIPAARTLRKLALAENERLANNATGVFKNLFQPRLGGTAKQPWERHVVLLEMVDSENDDSHRLVAEALDAALRFQHAMRDVGPEHQGPKITSPEWRPTDPEDIEKTIESSLNVLMRLTENADEPVARDAVKAVAGHTRELISLGFTDILLESLGAAVEDVPSARGDLVVAVERALHFDGEEYPEKRIERLRAFRDSIEDPSLEGQLEFYVWGEHGGRSFLRRSEDLSSKLEELAQSVLESPDMRTRAIPRCLTEREQKFYKFGRALGECDEEAILVPVFTKLLGQIEHPNLTAYGTYLAAIRDVAPEAFEEAMNDFADLPSIHSRFPALVSLAGIDDARLEQLTEMLEQDELAVDSLRPLERGSWVASVETASLETFLGALLKEAPDGLETVFGILFQAAQNEDKILAELEEYCLSVLGHESVLPSSDMDAHRWESIATKLLENRPDLRAEVVEAVLSNLDHRRGVGFRECAHKVLRRALSMDPHASWRQLANMLEESAPQRTILARLIAGRRVRHDEDDTTLFSQLPMENVWIWVGDDPKRAAVFAMMIPMEEHEPGFHPAAAELLDRFPDDGVGEALAEGWMDRSGRGWSEPYASLLERANAWSEDDRAHVADWARRQVPHLENRLAGTRELGERIEERYK